MATLTPTATTSTTAAARVASDFCDYLLRHLDASERASEQLNARQRRALRAAILAVRQRYSGV